MSEVVEQLVVRLSADVANLQARMEEVATQVSADNREIQSSTESLSASLKAGMESVLAFWGAWKFEEAAHALVEANIHMQQIQYTLEYATGSAKGASQQLAFLGQVSSALGINLQEAGMQFARILASAQGQNISVATLQSLYLGLAKTFDILHASTYQQQRVMQTFSEMLTMGTVHAQQFRMMLGRDLPGVNFVGMAAKELGLTTEQFNVLLNKGEITAQEVIPAVAKALNDAADKGTALQDAIHGTNATLNRFHTAVFELEANLSQKMAPAMNAVVDQATKILHSMDPMNTKMDESKAHFTSLRETVNGLVEGFLGIKAAVVTVFDIVKAVIDTVVSQIITNFRMAILGVQTLGDAFMLLLRVVQGVGAGMTNVIRQIVTALEDVFKGQFDSAKAAAEGIGQAFTSGFHLSEFSQKIAAHLNYIAELGRTQAGNLKEAWVGAAHDIASEWSTTSQQIAEVSSASTSEAKGAAIPKVTGQAPTNLTSVAAGVGGGKQSSSLSDEIARSLNHITYQSVPTLHLQGLSAPFQQMHDQMRRIDEYQKNVAEDTRQRWTHMMDPVVQAFSGSIQGMIRGTQTLQGAMRNMFQSIVGEFISMTLKLVEKWIAGEAAKTAATMAGESARLGIKSAANTTSLMESALTIGKEILMKMWNVMAGVYSAIAAIPYVGPFLAPAMAVAAGATIAGYAAHVASAAGGYWEVPHDQMAMIHKQEMVLPAWGAQGLRNMLAGGGSPGGDVHLHLGPNIDGGSARRFLLDNSDAVAESLRQAVRAGGGA